MHFSLHCLPSVRSDVGDGSPPETLIGIRAFMGTCDVGSFEVGRDAVAFAGGRGAREK